MTTISIQHQQHHSFVPRPRVVRLAAIAFAIVSLGLVGASALGNTNVEQGPPSSIETLSEMNGAATP